MRSIDTSASAIVVALFASLVLGSAVLVSCASDDGGATSAEPAKEESAPAKETAKEQKAEPPKGVAPPAGSKMAKLANNMSPQQVQEIMGAPSGQTRYPTGKSFAFAPFQYSNDSGWRMEYKYKGEGRVIFAEPRWGGNAKVVRVDYDPAEDGN
jgi:YD repeat-containing protein